MSKMSPQVKWLLARDNPIEEQEEQQITDVICRLTTRASSSLTLTASAIIYITWIENAKCTSESW